MRFLIVDDSETSLKHVRHVIAEMGHTVAGVAHDGEEAVAMYDTLRPDAVVMDVIMPKLNGIEALQAIRRLDPGAAVVMTCSLRSCETAFESQRCGAMYFLTKPFQDAALRNVLRKLASHRVAQAVAGEPKPVQQWAASQQGQSQWQAKEPPVAPPKHLCSDAKNP